ncbi:hypothetical protein SFRURICE_012031 [Spodoptera frugiperda]|nr:hypothetical protein SFRURICE_012031 [Spodoptera frugiperda]
MPTRAHVSEATYTCILTKGALLIPGVMGISMKTSQLRKYLAVRYVLSYVAVDAFDFHQSYLLVYSYIAEHWWKRPHLSYVFCKE